MNHPSPRVPRRVFIQTGASVALSGPFAGRLWGRSAPSDRITMGLIGCGGMGIANLDGFLRMDDVQVLAVCDPDRTRREATRAKVEGHYADEAKAGTYRGCDDYNDYHALLARDDIDAIIQATPDHWHAPVVVDAARAGKDMYGEKPLSLTIDQGRLMADTVKQFGRVFQTGSQQRSDTRFHHACELVRNGRIGAVQRVTCGLPTSPSCPPLPTVPVPDGFDYDRWLGPAPYAPYCQRRTHWDFRWISDYSGGQVTDWGAHHIDIAHWGLGLEETGPVEVAGTGTFPDDGLFDVATNFDFTARYRSGVPIRVTNHVENGVRWEGEDGWIFVTRGRIAASDPRILRERIRPNERRLPRPRGGNHRRDFIACVRDRGATIAPIEQAHRTITVAHLGNIAMKLGRPVRWNPDTEQFAGDAVATRLRDRAMRAPWLLAWLAATLIGIFAGAGANAAAADPGLDAAFAAAATHEWNTTRTDLRAIERAVVAALADPEACRLIEDRLVALLEAPGATRAARAFACRQLQLAGSARCVPALARWLDDADTRHMARFALEAIPGAAADRALQMAAARMASGDAAGIVHSMTRRHGRLVAVAAHGDASHVPWLLALAGAGDETARASLERMSAAGVDAALTLVAGTGDIERRLMAIDLLGARGAVAERSALDRLTDRNQPAAVRAAAGVAIADLYDWRHDPGRVSLLDRALATADSADSKHQVLAAMERHGETAMLPAVQREMRSGLARAAAARVVVALARDLESTDRVAARTAVTEVRERFADDQAVAAVAADALAHFERNEGYLTGWMVSGPYAAGDESDSPLIDRVFAPEPEGTTAATWQPVTEEAWRTPGIVDLNRIYGGTERCAYGRVRFVSASDQEAQLELGSDDGVKVWLNGTVVHRNDAMRGLTLREDRVRVRLRAGENTLLVKVTQGGGDWQFAVRLRSPNGMALAGVGDPGGTGGGTP